MSKSHWTLSLNQSVVSICVLSSSLCFCQEKTRFILWSYKIGIQITCWGGPPIDRRRSVQQISKVACDILWCLSSPKIKLKVYESELSEKLPKRTNACHFWLTASLWLFPRVSFVSCQKVIGSWSDAMSCFPYSTTSYVLYLRMLLVSCVFCPVFCEALSFGLQQ